MFTLSSEKIPLILSVFGITSEVSGCTELQRYDYIDADSGHDELRLILKVNFADRNSVVVRIGDELRFPNEVLETQSEFSEHLRMRGILVPQRYHADEQFQHRLAPLMELESRKVTVSVEDFMEGEIKSVNSDIAYKSGILLAQTHNISESGNCHVNFRVLFNPLEENDLFFTLREFREITEDLSSEYNAMKEKILNEYERRMEQLKPMEKYARFAVQGDFSDCNMFIDEEGKVGLFDFNNCGDNYLFADAVMQAYFISHLMEYSQELTEEFSAELFKSVLRGYNSVRPFSTEERSLIQPLYAVINAFERGTLYYNDDSLKKSIDNGDGERISFLLERVLNTISEEFDAGI